MKSNDIELRWQSVIARSLAFLCLASADLRDKDLATQGAFLEGLGLSRDEAAGLLGTSEASLSELLRRAKKKKGGKRGNAKKKR